MSLKEREAGILRYLREHGKAEISELCRALFVSAPTMRRDLASLHAAGKITRTHGGATLHRDPWENLPQADRERENTDAKHEIGKKCLALIGENDTVMVDGSSTGLALLRQLGGKRSAVVVTTNAEAPLVLSDPKIKLFVSGGEIAAGTYAYVGSHAEEFLRGFNADLCFFSVRTLTLDGKLTDNAVAENALRRVMLKNAKRSVLMLDSAKLGDACISTLCDLSEIDLVVSERDLSSRFPQYKEKFL